MKTLNTKSYRLGLASGGSVSASAAGTPEDRRSFIIRMAVMVIAACIFVFAGFQIFMIFYKYHESDVLYSNISNEVLNSSGKTTVITAGEAVDGDDTTNYIEITVDAFDYDHEKLLATNSDAVGYIYMPASNMRLPVVQGEDNDYYLTHSINGTTNSSGTIFEDCDIRGGLSATNIILYGHHMKNDGMFAPLKYYVNNGYSYYSSGANDVFYIYTGNRIIQYKIFSVHEDDPVSYTYTYNFPDLTSLREYAQQMKDLSIYDTGVDVSNATQIITLSTCTASGDERIIVQGVYVGEGILNSEE
jgi:sortase B